MGPDQSTGDLLSLVDVFEPLLHGEIEEALRPRPGIRLEAGEAVYGPTDLYESLFVLKSGRGRPHGKTGDGREFTLAEVESGTVFGEAALASRRFRGVHAECAEESEVLALRGEELERLILKKPEVGLRLINLLADRLGVYETRLVGLGSREVPARLADLILPLIEAEGVRTLGGYKLPTRYTHHRLGTMIWANREAVTRAFSRLRQAGVLYTENRLICARNIEDLRRAADGALPVRA